MATGGGRRSAGWSGRRRSRGLADAGATAGLGGPVGRDPVGRDPVGRGPLSDDAAAGLVAALAFPERVARARGEGAFLMASGTAAALGDGSGLRSAPWLAVAVADRPPHAASARVGLAAPLDEETARAAAGHLFRSGEEVRWEDGDLVARSVTRLGAIELAARPLKSPDPALVRGALLDGSARRGWVCCAGRRTRGRCGPGWGSCTVRSAVRGPTWPTTRRWWTGPTSGWSPSCPGPGAGPTWAGSMPGRR